MVISYLFLLFGLQLSKPESKWNRLFLIINFINSLITFGLTILTCIFLRSTANQLILLIAVIFNCISQIYLQYHKCQLIKLQSDIITNISSKSLKYVKRISSLLTFLVTLVIIIDLTKSIILIWFNGLSIFTINFHPYLFELINLLYAADDFNINYDNIWVIWFTLLIVINLHNSITIFAWFITTLNLYTYFYLAIGYLNQSLLNYTKKMLAKYYKVGDLTSLVFAYRKVYNMKSKFNQIVTFIPFFWLLQLFIFINIILGDLLLIPDREIELCLLYNLPTIFIILLSMVSFTVIIGHYQQKDKEIIKRITRLICIETTRSESIERLTAFLTEIQLFPTIKLTLAHWIPFNCCSIICFLLLIVNCLALWLFLTPYGRIIIGFTT